MTFFGREILVRTFFGVDKSETQGLGFYVKQYYCIMMQKLFGILLNYYYFFNWTFLGLCSGPLDFFWVRV